MEEREPEDLHPASPDAELNHRFPAEAPVKPLHSPQSSIHSWLSHSSLLRCPTAHPTESELTSKKVMVGRYCHNCGRASPDVEVTPEDRCLRCGQHLRACANCVQYDGVACLLQRPEVHDTYPGRDCPEFQFRESQPQATEET